MFTHVDAVQWRSTGPFFGLLIKCLVLCWAPRGLVVARIVTLLQKADQTGGSANNKTQRVMVVLHVYEAVRRWLTDMCWSSHCRAKESRPTNHEAGHYTVTWAELVVDYARIACPNIQLPGEDVEDHISILRMLVRKIC